MVTNRQEAGEEQMLRKDMIREIQLMNLKSLKKLDEICKRHGLKYWALYGTLLGAVRHQGFIPWDDDLDVGMMRKDFEVLCSLPRKEWGEDCIFLHAGCDDPRHDKLFGRVYQDKSKIQSPGDVNHWIVPATGKPFYTSLMCDVFVFDEMPDDDALYRRLHRKIFPVATRKYKCSKYLYHSADASVKEKLKTFVRRTYGLYMRKKYGKPWRHLDEFCTETLENLNRGGRRIGTFYTTDPYLYEKEDYFPLDKARFEDMEIPVPRNFKQVLQDMYGDYMQYPPENERYHINFIYVNLGDGREYVIDPMKGSLGEK